MPTNELSIWMGYEIKQLIDDLVFDQGYTIGEILLGTGLTPTDFNNPALRLPKPMELMLYIRLANMNKNPMLALQHGQRMTLKDLGILGSLMTCCNNLKQACEVAIRFSQLISFSAVYQCKILPSGDLLLSLSASPADPITNRFEVESSFACMLMLFQELLNQPIALKQVSFTHCNEPLDSAIYESLFQCPVLFEQEHNSLTLDQTYTTQPIPYALPEYIKPLSELCSNRIAALHHDKSLATRVKSFLQSYQQSFPTLKDTAQFLSVSDRTLKRRLKAQDTNFQAILDEVRFERAQQLLIGSRLTIHTIATTLGYSDVANFRAAFKRWADMTPRDYRAQYGYRTNSKTHDKYPPY